MLKSVFKETLTPEAIKRIGGRNPGDLFWNEIKSQSSSCTPQIICVSHFVHRAKTWRKALVKGVYPTQYI